MSLSLKSYETYNHESNLLVSGFVPQFLIFQKYNIEEDTTISALLLFLN